MRCLRVILISLVAISTGQGEHPKVSTPLGDVSGSVLTTRLNKLIYAFRGIRYALPPVGDLRFKPPLPVEKWCGVYNATVDAPVCPQPTDDPVSEDCLFLNVYTTKLPDGTKKPRRPVIVFIHAGGFYSVGGRSNWAGPQYFLDQDIVLVTINYRLASLGFISTGTEDAPGNNGLKDQVLALKWVKDNIEFFGGNPLSVTLFGYSAGSLSINLHLVSPMSRGLFHKAIMGSGSAVGQFVLPNNQLELAKKQARVVGCPDDSPKKILDCLKKVPAEVLGNSLGNFDEFGYDPILVWFPIVEKNFGQKRFLTEDPNESFKRGDFAKVPVVIGITEKEFGYRAFSNETLRNELSNNFDKNAPIAFIYERGTNRSKKISAAVRKFYLGSGPITNDSFSGLDHVYADSVIGFPVNRAVNLISEKNSANVYYYQFTYRGRYSHFTIPGTNGTTWGAVHHDDLIYLFYISPLFPLFNETYPEREMVEKLTTLWASFARTGKPISNSCKLFKGINWEPYNTTTKKYLDIGNDIALKEDLYQERYDFWNELFPIRKSELKCFNSLCIIF